MLLGIPIQMDFDTLVSDFLSHRSESAIASQRPLGMAQVHKCTAASWQTKSATGSRPRLRQTPRLPDFISKPWRPKMGH